MLLYVMRHGPAEDQANTGRDSDRELTQSGRSVVERAAQALRKARTAPLLRLYSSPLVRAAQTADIVRRIACDPSAQVAKTDALSTTPPSEQALVELVCQLGQAQADCLVVGHNPHVDELVRELASQPIPLRGFRTSMIVALEPTGHPRSGAFALRSVIDPHEL
jgi:phosphohistidine phosphatase